MMARAPRGTPADGGFTLLELMMAVLILLVAAVTVAQMVPASIGFDLRNRNDSTALIAAQRLAEQMTLQSVTSVVTSCPNNVPPAGNYAFCDKDGDTIALGDITSSNSTTSVGCPLTSTGQLDFTQPASSCPSGYTQTKTYTWNPSLGTTRSIDLRWRVITMRNSYGVPYRKVFIVGGRSGDASQSLTVTNLETVVGR